MEIEFDETKRLVSRIILGQAVIENDDQLQMSLKYLDQFHEATESLSQLRQLPGLMKLAILASKRELNARQRQFLAEQVLLSCMRDSDRRFYEMWQNAKLVP